MSLASNIQDKKFSGLIAFVCLLAGAAALAYGGVFVRESELSPTASALYRVVFAAPIFFVLYRFSNDSSDKKNTSNELFRFLLVGMIFSGNLLFYHLSIYYTTLVNANLLANLAPIFVVLYMYFIFKVHVEKGFLFAIVVTLVGLILLLSARAGLELQYNLGNLYGVISGAFYGAYLLALTKVRPLGNTNLIMAWGCLGTILILFPINVLLGENLVPSSLEGWKVLLLLAVISHVGGQGLIAFALAYLPTSVSSLTLVLQIVFASIFGWLLVGEVPLTLEVLGGIVIVIGVLLGKRFSS